MKKALRSVAYMFLLTLFFTGLVSAFKLINDERIELNQTVKLQRIVLKVLDIRPENGASDKDLLRLFEERIKPVNVQDQTLYVGYEADERTIKGFAFPVGGPGFWGPIYGMVAVTPQADRILGLAFYKHSETPGLGARMTEKWFTDQFKDLKLHPIKDDKKIFYLKTAGTGRAADELDAITGASRTSEAVETFLNNDLDRFLKEFWGALKKESMENAGKTNQ